MGGQEKMKAIVKTIKPKQGQRIIAISDIHGNLDVFIKLLKKIHFCHQDILVIVGDLLEKGPKSLETLRYIMKLSRSHEVYPILGNCDMALLSLNSNDDNDRLKWYLKTHKSAIHEMYHVLGKIIDEDTDMSGLKANLLEHFHEEIEWLSNLPHILVAGQYIFAHAAIESENLEENDVQSVISNGGFLKEEHQFSHTVVVGHMPCVVYQDEVACANPIIDTKKNIISIDGGNVLNISGQLNALIIPDCNHKKVSYDFMDLLPRAYVLKSQHPRKDKESTNVRWTDGKVKVLEHSDGLSYCMHLITGQKLWILDDVLSEEDGIMWADEGTDYELTLEQGEEVSVVRMTSRGHLVKKDGVMGWYYGELELISETE